MREQLNLITSPGFVGLGDVFPENAVNPSLGAVLQRRGRHPCHHISCKTYPRDTKPGGVSRHP
jgi:hypothetical protein